MGTSPTDPRVAPIGTEPSYFKSNNDSGALYACTRANYYSSASAKVEQMTWIRLWDLFRISKTTHAVHGG